MPPQELYLTDFVIHELAEPAYEEIYTSNFEDVTDFPEMTTASTPADPSGFTGLYLSELSSTWVNRNKCSNNIIIAVKNLFKREMWV